MLITLLPVCVCVCVFMVATSLLDFHYQLWNQLLAFCVVLSLKFVDKNFVTGRRAYNIW